MNPTDPRVELLQRYAQGNATADDMAALEVSIIHDAEFRRFVVEYLHVDASLEEYAATLRPARTIAMPLPKVWKLAAAAVVMIALGVSSLWWPQRGLAVEVVSASGGAAPEFVAGRKVRLGTLKMLRGDLRLRLTSGVLLDVAAPAELRFVDPMRVNVMAGRVTADVGERGTGFVVETAQLRVVDLGTKFGVEAKVDGQTDVAVLQGAVEVFDRRQDANKAKPVKRLRQGEAVRVNVTRQMARIVNVIGGSQPGEWSIQQLPDDCTIAAVSDDFGRDEEWLFYRIVPHGMIPGAAAYAMRPHTWEPAEGHKFPASLLGADLVQTFRGAGKRGTFKLQITVARPATLFVLMPARGMPAPWLAQTFTRTGEKLTAHGNDGRHLVPVSFEVWKREVKTPSVVTLGPANHGDETYPTLMYGIAAKPL